MKTKDLFSLLMLVPFLISVGCGGGSSANSAASAVSLLSMLVTPVNPSVPVGNTRQFTASCTYSDGTSNDMTTQVTWRSSKTSVATVNSSGLATAVAAGTATITASSGSISGNTTLTVTAAGTISLAWDAPTTNADGSPLTDLAGYKIYYGTAAGTYDHSIPVGNVTTYPLTGLTQGQSYYLAVTTIDTSNNESGYSNEVSGPAK